MLKKAGTQGIKEHYQKLLDRLNTNMEEVEKLL
jgi:hypothetical protein